MLTSLALVWFTRRARMRVTICVFIHTHTGTLARSQHYCWPVQTIRSAFSFQTPSALSQEPQGALAWLPHMYSDLAQGTLVISQIKSPLEDKDQAAGGIQKNHPFPRRLLPKRCCSRSADGCALALGQCPAECRCSLEDGRPRCSYRSLRLWK